MSIWAHLFNLLLVLGYVVIFGFVGYFVVKKAIKDALKEHEQENRTDL